MSYTVTLIEGDGIGPEVTRAACRILNAAGAPVSFMELAAPFGHDSFLLDAPEMNRIVDGFLRAGENL
mgnify:CR=1 FL=1